jgi:hypothetical protein
MFHKDIDMTMTIARFQSRDHQSIDPTVPLRHRSHNHRNVAPTSRLQASPGTIAPSRSPAALTRSFPKDDVHITLTTTQLQSHVRHPAPPGTCHKDADDRKSRSSVHHDPAVRHGCQHHSPHKPIVPHGHEPTLAIPFHNDYPQSPQADLILRSSVTPDCSSGMPTSQSPLFDRIARSSVNTDPIIPQRRYHSPASRPYLTISSHPVGPQQYRRPSHHMSMVSHDHQSAPIVPQRHRCHRRRRSV